MVDNSVALVVNAGGQSRRMGREKALLPVPPDDKPLLVHIVGRLAALVTDRVVIVTNDATVARTASALENALAIPDRWADGGALGGIATGLAHCRGWAMVVACDMPLVDPAIFAKLLDVARAQPHLDVVIPRAGGRAQPFHGLWHRRALPTLEVRIQEGALRVQDALAKLNCAWFSEDELGIHADDPAFYNANTPREWQEILDLMANQNRPVA